MEGVSLFLSLLERIIQKASAHIFGFFSAFLSATIILLLAAYFDPDNFAKGAKEYCPKLLILSTITLALYFLKRHSEKTIQTVNFTPYGHECWAHQAVQPNGQKFTQIACYLHVFNLTDEGIWLPEVRLIKPKTLGMFLNRMILVKEYNGRYSGGYQIPPKMKADASVHMMIDTDITGEIMAKGITIEILDQHKHRHVVKFSNVKILPNEQREEALTTF